MQQQKNQIFQNQYVVDIEVNKNDIVAELVVICHLSVVLK